MPRDSGRKLNGQDAFGWNTMPLRNSLRRDVPEGFRQPRRPADFLFCDFKCAFHESDESMAFYLLQEKLSVNESAPFRKIGSMKTKAAAARAERIIYLRKKVLGFSSQEKLAEAIAAEVGGTLTRGAVGNWERGEGIDLIYMEALTRMTGCSLDWIARGIGELPPPRGKDRSREGRYTPEPDLPPGFDRPVVSSVDDALGRPKNTSTILEIDVRAGAGGGGTSIDAYVIDGDGNSYSADGVKDQWQLPDTIMRQELHASPAHIRIFEVIGDSMLPVLHERDRVFIDTRLKAPAPEGIFALWDGQGLVIKRLQMINPSDPPRVRIISANKGSYDPYEMPLSDIQIIGRFAGKFTTQLAG